MKNLLLNGYFLGLVWVITPIAFGAVGYYAFNLREEHLLLPGALGLVVAWAFIALTRPRGKQ